MGFEEEEKSEEEEKEIKKEKKTGRDSGKGKATDDKFKWSKANEWGKLDWNNKMKNLKKETDEEICKIEIKNKTKIKPNIVTGWEMQETIEEEWKSKLEEKSENNFINRNKQKCGQKKNF